MTADLKKRWYLCANLHGAGSLKNGIFISTAVKTSYQQTTMKFAQLFIYVNNADIRFHPNQPNSLKHGNFTTTLPSRPNLRFFLVELLLLPEFADVPLSFFQRISISQSLSLLTDYTPHAPQYRTSPRTELRIRVAACYEAASNMQALGLQTTHIHGFNH
jgi:hypothetical protein